MRVEVFNGWVQLRNPDLVPERLRRPVFEKSVEGAAIANNENMTQEALEFFSEFNDLLAVAMIDSWSFGEAVSVEAMQDLPSKTYDEIRNLVSPYIQKLIPNFEVDIDPKATTEILSESAGS
jgi:hypothetical protein